jgi:hypothetical protein
MGCQDIPGPDPVGFGDVVLSVGVSVGQHTIGQHQGGSNRIDLGRDNGPDEYREDRDCLFHFAFIVAGMPR